MFVANTKEFNAVGPIAACDAIRNDLAKRQRPTPPMPTDPAAQDKAEALSAQSDAEFLKCFAEQAPQQAGFAAAVKAAQTLLDRLPTH